MDNGGRDHLNGRLGLRAAVWQYSSVCVCELGLLLPRLNGGPVCDDSATEGGMHKCGTVYVNLTFLHV